MANNHNSRRLPHWRECDTRLFREDVVGQTRRPVVHITAEHTRTTRQLHGARTARPMSARVRTPFPAQGIRADGVGQNVGGTLASYLRPGRLVNKTEYTLQICLCYGKLCNDKPVPDRAPSRSSALVASIVMALFYAYL